MKLQIEKSKVLIKYIREKDEYLSKVVKNPETGLPEAKLLVRKGRIKGCIVSTAKGCVGWSLMNKKDQKWSWNDKEMQEICKRDKELAFDIAYKRSLKCETLLHHDDVFEFMHNIPFSLVDDVNEMLIRSKKYYK